MRYHRRTLDLKGYRVFHSGKNNLDAYVVSQHLLGLAPANTLIKYIELILTLSLNV